MATSAQEPGQHEDNTGTPVAKPYEQVRARIWNPITKKMEQKSFSKRKYKDQDLQALCDEWKREKQKEFEAAKALAPAVELAVAPPEPAPEPAKAPSKEPAKETSKEPKPSTFKLPINMKTGFTTAIIGASKSGKTTLLAHIYDKYYGTAQPNLVTTLFTPNFHASAYADLRRQFKAAKSNLVVSAQYQPEVVSRAYQIQKGTANHYDFCFMFDDMVDIKEAHTHFTVQSPGARGLYTMWLLLLYSQINHQERMQHASCTQPC